MKLPKLKEFREKREYSQATIASIANVTQQTVHRAEKGKSVTYSTAIRLAAAVGATLTELSG